MTKVSCLMITENRPHFADWMAWQVAKQTYPHELMEFVLVATPRDEETIERVRSYWPALRVIMTEINSPVPVKRNAAVAAAQHEVITWFDDDDWSAARRLELIIPHWEWRKTEHPELKVLTVKSTLGYFEFPTGMVYERLFSSWQYSLYDRELAQRIPFRVRRLRGSDAYWTKDLKQEAQGKYLYAEQPVDPEVAQARRLWSCQEVSIPGIGIATAHGQNICNTWTRLRVIRDRKGRLRRSDYVLVDGEWERTIQLLHEVAAKLGITWTEPIEES